MTLLSVEQTVGRMILRRRGIHVAHPFLSFLFPALSFSTLLFGILEFDGRENFGKDRGLHTKFHYKSDIRPFTRLWTRWCLFEFRSKIRYL